MDYPNIEALADGRISGEFSEWSRVKPEAKAILEELAGTKQMVIDLQRAHEALLMTLRASRHPWIAKVHRNAAGYYETWKNSHTA